MWLIWFDRLTARSDNRIAPKKKIDVYTDEFVHVILPCLHLNSLSILTKVIQCQIQQIFISIYHSWTFFLHRKSNKSKYFLFPLFFSVYFHIYSSPTIASMTNQSVPLFCEWHQAWARFSLGFVLLCCFAVTTFKSYHFHICFRAPFRHSLY